MLECGHPDQMMTEILADDIHGARAFFPFADEEHLIVLNFVRRAACYTVHRRYCE
jgi:hypothetical protein